MKFGRRLLEELMEPNWEVYYVQYHTLKKIIFAIVQAQKHHRGQEANVLHEQFYARLEANLAAAEAFAEGLLAEVRSSREKVIKDVQAVRHPGSLSLSPKDDQALVTFVHWAEKVASLLKFCVTNRTAMRKITKKLDKNFSCAKTETTTKAPVPWTPSRQPFEKIQQELTNLMRVTKDVEYGIMTVSTQISARLRSIRALRFAETERLKLRRVEHFESELVRPFMLDRCAMREVYFEWRPLRISSWLAMLILAGVALHNNMLEIPPQLIFSALRGITFLIWIALVVLYVVQAVVVQAKLGRIAAGWRRLSMFAAIYLFAAALLRISSPRQEPGPESTFIAHDDDDNVSALIALCILCGVEAALYIRLPLGITWAIVPRALAFALIVIALLGPCLDAALQDYVHKIVQLAVAMLSIGFLGTVKSIRIDVQLRKDVGVLHL
ncbi:Hypothetical Protein FCC1311_034222 [Hondaea fermentalgiana]|uniref:SPX domain-containing protein n=1 Tax=Hondaea fermentalgiana TaxID=2315210 RepID=A0A2R5GA62_9STRA|nr:Hypothetical Protein FCC1311_034222 [Hondaea fermentalgiana]|eukprot:GBG27199.1 Hypothetical Protein FCC1311_034222 [Hondaea fermentalgiana]